MSLPGGALTLLLKQMKPKDKAKKAKAPHETAKAALQHVGVPPKS